MQTFKYKICGVNYANCKEHYYTNSLPFAKHCAKVTSLFAIDCYVTDSAGNLIAAYQEGHRLSGDLQWYREYLMNAYKIIL